MINDDAFEKREEIECLVVGGTISTKAATRSKNVSSADSSEETEESDADEDVREDEVEAYGEDDLDCWSFSSTISTLTIVVDDERIKKASVT